MHAAATRVPLLLALAAGCGAAAFHEYEKRGGLTAAENEDESVPLSLLPVVNHHEPYSLDVLGERRIFYAKHEQDRQLIEEYPHWLTHRTGKTYLEMGALDGVTVSNTKFFYDLGWRGVLVEPQDACRALIARHRPEDIVYANASCAGFASFPLEQVVGECVGGVGGRDYLNERREDSLPNATTVDVSCSPIGHMLRLANVTKLDLWSLDVEGAERTHAVSQPWTSRVLPSVANLVFEFSLDVQSTCCAAWIGRISPCTRS